jgi:tetratricopeptide (TPR) repeat protein
VSIKVSFSAAAMGLILAASILAAQTQQTGQTGSGGTTGGTTNTGGAGTNPTNPGATGTNPTNSTGNRGTIITNPNSPNNPNSQQLPPRQQQILMITGSVILDDGTPPPMGVVIERECAGRRTREANVSPNGSFGFQVGGINGNNNILPDASESGFGSPWDLNRASSLGFPGSMLNPATSIAGCELRAQFGGYRSSTIMLTSDNAMGVIEVGAIVLYPAARVRGTTISATSLAAPKDAQRALARAEKAFQKKRLDEAEKETLAALKTYPVYAAAWFRLGQVYVQSDRIVEARTAYAKAVEADANFVNPSVELARLAARDAKWEETARLTDHALELDPVDFPYAYYMNAVAHYNLGHFDVAEKSGHKLNQIDSLHRWPQIHLVLASILRRKSDFGGEAVQLRAYLKYAPESADAAEVRSRLSVLEKGGMD